MEPPSHYFPFLGTKNGQSGRGDLISFPSPSYMFSLGRYDFGLFLNFITGKQGLLCVTETWRYGYIRDYGDRVETPHGTTIGCEKSSNGL